MFSVVVTGGSGRVGSWLIQDLLRHGYQVTSVDGKINPNRPNGPCRSVTADLNDYREVYDALEGADAVIHLAAIPAFGIVSNEVTFANNTVSTYNVLEAGVNRGIGKFVIGSSESIYGFAYARTPFSPRYVPIDEEHPLLFQECYGLSKLVNELTAEMFARTRDLQVIALRFASVLTPDDVRRGAARRRDPEYMRKPFWSYIDIRDAVAACRLGLECGHRGVNPLNITADDTIVDIPTRQLLREYFPEIDGISQIDGEFQSLFSNRRAKQLLNWQPVHSWRSLT